MKVWRKSDQYPLFGKRTTLNLDDFFDLPRLKELSPDPESDINLIIGPGA